MSTGFTGAELAPACTNHFVEFYEDDAELADTVSRYMALGLARGGCGVVIAEPDHRTAIEDRLRRTPGFEDARLRGRYIAFDARETMSLFMRAGLPVQERFEAVLGSIIATLPEDAGDLHLFGEMVAVLWAEGNVAGAIALEDLWNTFLQSHPARLFCAYPHSVVEEDPAGADLVRHTHSHILLPSQAGR